MIPLARPDIGEQEVAAVAEVLRSGQLVQGRHVAALETAAAEYLGCAHVVAVTSGTAALHLALLALEIGPGDEVIVPDFTFPATANAVELVGATPVLADIRLDTFNIDPAVVEKLITPKTKAIIPVHEFGCPADIDALSDLAARHRLAIVEDAACALGATFRGRACGTFGALGCFSLHPRKAITTGEGGLIATDSDALADKLRILRNHGIVRQEGRVDFVCAGYNYRMTEIQAAMGCVQMTRLEGIIRDRQRLAEIYRRELPETVWTPAEPENGGHVYQTFHVLMPDGTDRDGVIGRLRDEGIETNYGANALHLLSHHRKFAGACTFPNAEKAFTNGLALPLYSSLTGDDVARVCRSLWAIIG